MKTALKGTVPERDWLIYGLSKSEVVECACPHLYKEPWWPQEKD